LAISARPRSEAEFALALLKITSDGTVVVRLEPYAKVGTDWPVLGDLFRDEATKEAEEMTGQIRAKLAISK